MPKVEGATTINVPDTVGYAIPELYGNFIKNLRERVPNSDKAIWSVHCHNDLGLASATATDEYPDPSGARQSTRLVALHVSGTPRSALTPEPSPRHAGQWPSSGTTPRAVHASASAASVAHSRRRSGTSRAGLALRQECV